MPQERYPQQRRIRDTDQVYRALLDVELDVKRHYYRAVRHAQTLQAEPNSEAARNVKRWRSIKNSLHNTIKNFRSAFVEHKVPND
jgi:hypothetical protein